MTRHAILLLLALLGAPVAQAEERALANETADAPPAWVEECPPDMMCAFSHQGESTCMDGADAGEACDPDARYLDGGAEAPPAPDAGAASGSARPVPSLGVALGILTLACVATLLGARRG